MTSFSAWWLKTPVWSRHFLRNGSISLSAIAMPLRCLAPWPPCPRKESSHLTCECLARSVKDWPRARAEMENVLQEQPDYPEALSILGMANAALGRAEEALLEGRRAAELLPVTKDAMTGAELLRNLAIVY